MSISMTTKANISGKVYLVGAGPGDPDLLTVKASKLLRSADLVLHDDLVSEAIVSLPGPQAIIVNVGKRCGAKKISQAEINRLMVTSAGRGMTVVRLKGGDPAIFGRLNEELDALEAAGVPFEVIPGVTASLGAAASLGSSLTDRRTSSRLMLVSGHHADEDSGEKKNDWISLVSADVTLAVYMPGRDWGGLSRELLDAGLSATSPCVLVSQATTPEQQQQWITLGELGGLPPGKSPAILLIGRALEGAARRAVVDLSSFSPDQSNGKSLIERVEPEISAATSDPHFERRVAP
jgi:uroporphyrin-III C-methyltransferase